ncbi:MAG: hypothetical protein V3W04_02800 [Gammaproteobacteria bacterium]
MGLYLPAVSENLLQNFQTAFDLLKAGYVKAAYVFIWRAHYLVLTLILRREKNASHDSVNLLQCQDDSRFACSER